MDLAVSERGELRGGTFRELAQRACVGFKAAREAVNNMYSSGELIPVGAVKVPTSKRPLVRYVPAQQAAWDACTNLGQVLSTWNR